MIKPGQRNPRLMLRLTEAQGYRCAVCSRVLSMDRGYDFPEWPSIVRFDRALPRTYLNSVVTCHPCSGRQSNCPSLTDYYNAVMSEAKAQIKEQPDCDLEVVAAIKARIRELSGLDLDVPVEYGRAPMSSVEHIAKVMASKHNDRPTREEMKERKKQRKAKWMNDGQRRRFMEIQRHRCVYCTAVFETDHVQHPRYPTWEHIETIGDGGTSKMNNVVVACSTCNNLRDNMGLSALEYAEWAADHHAEIEARAQHRIRALALKTRHKGKDWYLYNAGRTRPLFNS